MGEAIAAMYATYLESFYDSPETVWLKRPGENKPDNGWLFCVEPQHQIGRFKADFLVTCSSLPDKKLVVECDGHQFHERTKEQAQHDKSRDRDIQSAGYAIMRFTGSEIHKDPVACTNEIGDFFAAALGDDGYSRLLELAFDVWSAKDGV
ncbi:endonuclease domain-containing protein [Jiella pelagia]|uniref:DUF559 domain-containing protein n=1 Tax=Jiella pelagia TaxID=2986949 RepID=A0ABY7BZR5_9HYPH|nr:DUF559 domain-containing protein [Jiella pelagia]WAP69069.1 DUF559 domain-containing protein [Jiella pelagia]